MSSVGGVYRLAPSPRSLESAEFPRKLSETGLFASVTEHTPAPGLIPYSVTSALRSDGASKERFIALPGESRIDLDAVTYPQPAPGASPGWRFPSGTVLVKTFFLETERGNAASRRPIETRLLHYEELSGTEEFGNQHWLGYSYVWDDDSRDAVLVDASGLDRDYARLLVPGAADRSLIYQRMARLGLGRMPHVASIVVDEVGTGLVREWIAQLPEAKSSDAGG